MLHCPRCSTPLHRSKLKGRPGVTWSCAEHGQALTLALLRRLAAAPAAKAIWSGTRSPDRTGAPCPCCRQAMHSVALAPANGAVEVDVCRRCQMVWLDDGELAAMPAPPSAPAPQPPSAAQQKEAIARVQEMAQRERERAFPSFREANWWAAILGMPVELTRSLRGDRPWATWGTAAVTALVSILAFSWPVLMDTLALVPDELGRLGGLTLVTPFLVHGDWFHLLGNLYFLMVFGDDVERMLGARRWGLLLLVATFVGSIAHAITTSHGFLPCVGASGGISGLIVYYALRLPRARLGILLLAPLPSTWVTFSARTGLLLWIGTQFLVIYQQSHGVGGIAVAAHIGGALTGLVAWMLGQRT